MRAEPFTIRVELAARPPVDVVIDADAFTIETVDELKLMALAARRYGNQPETATAGAIAILAHREIPDVAAEELLSAVAAGFDLEVVE